MNLYNFFRDPTDSGKEEEMKSSVVMLLIAVLLFGFVFSGCAKKEEQRMMGMQERIMTAKPTVSPFQPDSTFTVLSLPARPIVGAPLPMDRIIVKRKDGALFSALIELRRVEGLYEGQEVKLVEVSFKRNPQTTTDILVVVE